MKKKEGKANNEATAATQQRLMPNSSDCERLLSDLQTDRSVLFSARLLRQRMSGRV